MSAPLLYGLEPIYRFDSKILILGSMPSPKSLAQGFYYAHPQNRFWKLLALLTDEKTPAGEEEKTELLCRHKIALWDVLGQCTREGALDSRIKNARPNDILGLLSNLKDAKAVFLNGSTAFKLYRKYFPEIKLPCCLLPSTSPANARMNIGALKDRWEVIKRYLLSAE